MLCQSASFARLDSIQTQMKILQSDWTLTFTSSFQDIALTWSSFIDFSLLKQRAGFFSIRPIYIRPHLKNLCRGGWKGFSEYIYENKAVTLLWPSSFSANSLYAPANLKRLLLFWWIFIRASCSCKVRKDQRNILKSIENRLVSTENWISLIGVFVLVLVHLWLYRFPGFLMGKGFCHSEFLSNRLFFVTY